MTDSVIESQNIFSRLAGAVTFMPQFHWKYVFEILIIAFLLYEMLRLIKNTRAWDLMQGLLVILAFTLVSSLLHLDTILWILEKIAAIAVMALIIIFQPELRKALEQIGSRNFITNFLPFDELDGGGFDNATVDEIVRGVFDMAKVKTGALIVIERKNPLSDILSTGIAVDGLVTSQLLINIFEHNTPLHDGAVVIRGNRVAAATCYLPLSDNMSISKALGTRHRAALGISEKTDSLTVVVSEETGRVCVMEDGQIHRVNDGESLKRLLTAAIQREETESGLFSIWKGRKKNERKADK